ncbi:MAG: synthase (F/14-kDa) subunit [Bryobacterales bacterium]|nr:synthase (F/14-kDa) subunit [Bryobacterales bacterium]
MAGQNIVVIADEDAVFGLGLIGLHGCAVTSVEDARQAIRNAMADPNTALILLTENWAEAQPESMGESDVTVIEIPSQQPVKPSIDIERRIEQALGFRLEY